MNQDYNKSCCSKLLKSLPPSPFRPCRERVSLLPITSGIRFSIDEFNYWNHDWNSKIPSSALSSPIYFRSDIIHDVVREHKRFCHSRHRVRQTILLMRDSFDPCLNSREMWGGYVITTIAAPFPLPPPPRPMQAADEIIGCISRASHNAARKTTPYMFAFCSQRRLLKWRGSKYKGIQSKKVHSPRPSWRPR